MLVRNETRDSILGESVDVADTSAKRRKGLLGRKALPQGQGLWIIPCEGVHSCGMKFAIDLVYLDRNERVLKVKSRMVPWRFSMCLRARSVLELPEGTISRTRTQRGDQLQFRAADSV